ncbi:Activating signal cointegrator 1 complex subunit 2 [Acromyrmex echinatior]|uniref:Activating signal cointegrator 1 complex subunit 2 n=1 Tax=Acromyrmex echinatior TaxID=103372 RepID=F4X1L0_ACREC|nr:Activating signal cointegrator 1 complex subunit 2 [Acromyrmex echinatior]
MKWADKRCFLSYIAPEIYNEDGSEIMGAKDRWMEIVSYIIEDLNWLLALPFYRFWSNIIYNTSIMDTLVSFLQEAPPFYTLESFPANVLIVFARLCTNKQSSAEYMNRPFLGKLLYNYYIFTIPIIFDLCQLYGRESTKVVEKIVDSVFSLQPMYNDDLQKSIPCLIKALENVERRFENCPSNATEAVALSERGDSIEMTLYNLEDLILYVLDISSTLTILLRVYPPVTATFHKDDFINKIVSIYGSTIPEMYKKLDKLAYSEENMPKYIELKHRLDVTRVEMLNLYRIIIYESILQIQEKINTITENEIRNCVDKYLDSLMNAISEKEFIIDYHQFYPVDTDLQIMAKLYPEIDTIKSKYILKSLHASIGDTKMLANASLNNTNIAVAGSSGIQNNQQKEHSNDVNCMNNKIDSGSKYPDNLMSLISEVKEILCDCGEGFIQLCLENYKYNIESVVNAVLEDKLPHNLKELDRTIPYIPPDPMETSIAMDLATANLVNDFQELNVSYNDKFEVTTEKFTDVLGVRKKKDKYRNANEMLNDKSAIREVRNIYEKYSIVTDEYDDEYDDTYDSHDIRSSAQDDSAEIDARSFTTPRVFQTFDKNNASSEDDTEIEDEKPVQNSNHFVQDPAELRAKAEQRKQSREGKSKGDKQDKNGSVNRRKNVYKATHGNHNRRMGAEIKRKQGMIPS